jgi:membrane-associated phospholipid phosphatase
MRFNLAVCAIAATLSLSGCMSSTSPEAARSENINQPAFGVALSQTLTSLVAQQRLGPLTASRIYGYTFAAAQEAYSEAGSVADAATAAELVASSLFFNMDVPRVQMNTLLRRYATDGASKVGLGIGQRWLDRADKDGFDDVLQTNQPAEAQPGELFRWSSTGMSRLPFADPEYGSVKPILPGSSSCDIAPPDTERITREARAMFENFDVGSTANSWVLLFLAGVATPTPPGQMLQFAANATVDSEFGEAQTLSLLTAVAVSGFDAGIIVWREKLEHMLARPETLFERLTGQSVLLARETPNHPSYPSGHSGFSGAAVEIMSNVFGVDMDLRIVLPPDLAAPREEFRFQGPDELLRAVNQSRVDAGFHFPADVEAGASLGRCIGRGALDFYFSSTIGPTDEGSGVDNYLPKSSIKNSTINLSESSTLRLFSTYPDLSFVSGG